jgi:2-C-methyl-D-erythritol 2,4-cyclodiphosphate synthase
MLMLALVLWRMAPFWSSNVAADSEWTNLIATLAPLLVIALLWMFMIRQMQAMNIPLRGFGAGSSRSGIAYDLHRLETGRPLMLGGIEVPFDKGPMGHSDGDVLAHAICDALLGAAGLDDIGTHFPDTDPQWKGASSLRFLEHTRKLLDEQKLRITHIDAVVVTEKPKLAPHFPAMREALARALGVRAGQINLKAKTNEGVDAVGRGEAIAAHAIATVES